MVITVECPSCAATFPVDPRKIPEGGVRVRCSACSEIFRVERPDEATTAAPPPPPPVEPEASPAEAADEAAPPEAATEEAPAAAPFEAPAAEGAEDEAPVEAPGEAPVEAAGEAAAEAPEAEAYEAPGIEEAAVEASEEAAPDLESPDDWVIETEDTGLSAEGVTTQEVPGLEATETLGEAAADFASSGFDAGETEETAGSAGEVGVDDPSYGMDPMLDIGTVEEAPAEEAPVEEPAAEEAPAPPPVQGFTFGQRDPKDKARRLARVLVSDMIMYNPERHERALANGTLKEDFEEEIQKSWKEYVEQVGLEMAEGTDYWTEALNDVLARGEQVF